MTVNRRFIFTGGPGAGKTTVLGAIARRGYTVVPESARAIIRERVAKGLPPREHQAGAVFARDIAAYEAHVPNGGRPVFFDRGLAESIGPMLGVTGEQGVAEKLAAYPFSRTVFIFPPWEAIYQVDDERDHTFEHAVKVHGLLSQWYPRHGFSLIEVPCVDIEARADFVLENTRAS